MRHYILLWLLLSSYSISLAQSRKTENLVIVTLDGMRWQEVFGGIDSSLLYNSKYTRDTAQLKKKYWSADINERRKRLFPFLWRNVAQSGQVYGNRHYNNFVNVANPHQFSYPGYNEIFTGYPDTSVNSNDKINNKNETVLEFINKQKGFEGKIAAFSSWDCFPYILNRTRSGLYINSDLDTFNFAGSQFKLINDLQNLSPRPLGVRPDILTFMGAREYLKTYHPRILYIAFDETDDFAHGGMYDQYIGAARAEDAMLANLWNTLQSIPQYKNKTTLIITTDHGRGDLNKDEWTGHGKKIIESGQIWMAIIGPDTKPSGEIKTNGQLYQAQIASTIASLLGFNFKTDHPVMEGIKSVLTTEK